jgi:hypothetical protein
MTQVLHGVKRSNRSRGQIGQEVKGNFLMATFWNFTISEFNNKLNLENE